MNKNILNQNRFYASTFEIRQNSPGPVGCLLEGGCSLVWSDSL